LLFQTPPDKHLKMRNKNNRSLKKYYAFVVIAIKGNYDVHVSQNNTAARVFSIE